MIKTGLFFMLFCSVQWLNAQHGLDKKNQYGFAEYLYHEKDYNRAAGEYFRYAYMNEGKLNDTILHKISLCYAMGNDAGKAHGYFDTILYQYPSTSFYPLTLHNKALLYSLENQPKKSNDFITASLSGINEPFLMLEMENMLAYNFIKLHDFSSAYQTTQRILKNSESAGSNTVYLETIANKGIDLNYKSPFLAGLFSALVPGTGKMYSGRVQDGLYSFILTAVTSWQAYDGFHKKGTQSVKGWVYTGVGLVFYAGNIFGSVVSAKVYNQRLQDELVQSLSIQFQFK